MIEALPQRVGQDRDIVASTCTIFRDETAAKERRDLENIEQVRKAQHRSNQPWRLAAKSHAQSGISVDRQSVETCSTLLPHIYVAWIGSHSAIPEHPYVLPSRYETAAIAVS